MNGAVRAFVNLHAPRLATSCSRPGIDGQEAAAAGDLLTVET
jgi:hypothetical protein